MVEIKPFLNQDYVLLKSQHSASNLFVDPEFPAEFKSINGERGTPTKDIKWKRPKVSRQIGNYGASGCH
jgi:hypothetical protein